VTEGESSKSSQIALYSVLLNLGVTITKATLALATGSAAVLADTIHGLSDLVASLAVWLGIKISRLNSREFPFGLYKLENLVEMGTGFLILFAGYEILRHMVLCHKGREITYIPQAMVLLVFLSVIIYLFVQYEKAWAQRLNSPALMADAEHWKADILSNGILVVSFLGSLMGIQAIDRIAAALIVVFIVEAAWKLLRNSIKSLLDASVDYSTLDKISRVVLAFPKVKRIKNIAARSSGPCIFAHVEVVIKEKDLKRAHDLTEEMEEAVKKAVPHVEKIFIHYEPEEKKEEIWVIPLEGKEGTISSYFGRAPYLAFLTLHSTTGKLLETKIEENPFRYLEKGRGVHLAEMLVERGVDKVLVKEDIGHKGPGFILRNAGTEVITTHARSLKEILEQKEVKDGGKTEAHQKA